MKWLAFTAATKRTANVVGDNKQYVNEKRRHSSEKVTTREEKELFGIFLYTRKWRKLLKFQVSIMCYENSFSVLIKI